MIKILSADREQPHNLWVGVNTQCEVEGASAFCAKGQNLLHRHRITSAHRSCERLLAAAPRWEHHPRCATETARTRWVAWEIVFPEFPKDL